MDDCIEWTMLESFAQNAIISDIAFDQVVSLKPFVFISVFALERWTIEGVEVVQGDHFDAIGKQLIDKMAAYKPRAARD